MAIATTKTYSKALVDAFNLASITRGVSSDAWNWAAEQGKTVVLTSNGVAQMNDYTRTGTSRYGTPAEIDNNQQEITCRKDRSFTFTIDTMGSIERGGTIEVNKQLRKQIDEVITPEIDAYTLNELYMQAGNGNLGYTPQITMQEDTLTKENAYETFLKLNSILDDRKVPAMNRTAWVLPDFYNMLKLDQAFTKASESTVKALTSGFLGDVDGVGLVKAPSSYMPTKDDEGMLYRVVAIIAHKDAWVQPLRLEEFKIHTNPQGISGTLVEGRVVYDTFVLQRLHDGQAYREGVAVLMEKMS